MKKYAALIVSVLIALFVLSCQPEKKSLTSGEGYIEMEGGKVWYRIMGQGDQTPLLLLHGGPGFPSYYLNPLGELSGERPVIFIDQPGCGRSEMEMDTSRMTVDFFVDNLEQVRLALGLDELYLYGHSWGTMLAADYYLKYPDHVKALILASPALSAPQWAKDARSLIGSLPDSLQTAITEVSRLDHIGNTKNGMVDAVAARITMKDTFLTQPQIVGCKSLAQCITIIWLVLRGHH